MSYLKSYGKAVYELSKVLGVIYLGACFFYGIGMASFYVYLALVAGLAGPVGVWINHRESLNA